MGNYLLRQTATGFKFDLKAGNGEVIGTSEVYTTKAAARNGINSVKKNAPIATIDGATNPKFEIYNDKAGKSRFRLLAKNGKNILASEAYSSLASCKNGIESVKNNSNSDII